ncbi:RNA polymerase sigma factor [Lentzea sp. CA-135723]|uniref:RNA polymerase sigma factor n=1 Tax=Lentzea sp. CA-135723 TaxID=3239950 RepID=UPI003D8A8895
MDALSDAELTRCAQAGDATAVGVLLQRHHASMRAVALSVVGYDAEDLLQDSALIALRRIGDVRDPSAVGAWLRAIVRNTGRMRLRQSPSAPLVDWAGDETPESVLDTHALRDWIWTALDRLTPTLQLPLLLRHFSGVTSYDDIAKACGLPVGTVRSRLNEARAKLSAALLATADRGHDDATRRHLASRAEAVDTLAAAEAGRFGEIVADRWSPHVTLTAGPITGGQDLVLAGMEGDLAAGVRQRPVNIIAGNDIAIWEMDLVNPPDNPGHCPPSVVWLMSLRGGRVERLRLFHPDVTPIT